MKKRIYLDNNATTGLDPRVREAMLSEMECGPSNPSSIHYFGQEAKNRLAKARQEIAEYFFVRPHEVIFTSGATESLNTLIRFFLEDSRPGHIISSNVEHACVYECLKEAERKGWKVSFLAAGLYGAVRPDAIEQAILPETKAIVLSAANSETGVRIEMDKIAEIAARKNIAFIVDGVGLLGKEFFSIPEGVSAIGFSGHKIHGPKGTGLILVRPSFKLKPLLIGGGQEFSKRAGTENLAGIAGLAEAVRLLRSELPDASIRMGNLRDYLEKKLVELCGARVNGLGPRVCNTTNLYFPHIDGESLLIQLDMAGVAASHGSACSSGSLEPSRILTSMGIPKKEAKSSIRFSLSRFTTKEEIDHTIEIVAKVISFAAELATH